MNSIELSTEELLFFDYQCDSCGAPLCERVQVMNLALDFVDDLFCVECLAKEQELSREALLEAAKDYVAGRDCFKTPWNNFAPMALTCPLLKYQACPCQD